MRGVPLPPCALYGLENTINSFIADFSVVLSQKQTKRTNTEENFPSLVVVPHVVTMLIWENYLFNNCSHTLMWKTLFNLFVFNVIIIAISLPHTYMLVFRFWLLIFRITGWLVVVVVERVKTRRTHHEKKEAAP